MVKIEDIDYTATEYNLHIENSAFISKYQFEDVLDYIQIEERDTCKVFDERSYFSLKNEWAAHNLLYDLKIAQARTISVDLNTPQSWYIKLAYNIFGLIARIFIN